MCSLICTILPLPAKCISVVNLPVLGVAVQRNTRRLTFDQFVVALSPRIFNMALRDMDIMKQNHDGGQRELGLMHDVHGGIYAALAPRPGLNQRVR